MSQAHCNIEFHIRIASLERQCRALAADNQLLRDALTLSLTSVGNLNEMVEAMWSRVRALEASSADVTDPVCARVPRRTTDNALSGHWSDVSFGDSSTELVSPLEGLQYETSVVDSPNSPPSGPQSERSAGTGAAGASFWGSTVPPVPVNAMATPKAPPPELHPSAIHGTPESVVTMVKAPPPALPPSSSVRQGPPNSVVTMVKSPPPELPPSVRQGLPISVVTMAKARPPVCLLEEVATSPVCHRTPPASSLRGRWIMLPDSERHDHRTTISDSEGPSILSVCTDSSPIRPMRMNFPVATVGDEDAQSTFSDSDAAYPSAPPSPISWRRPVIIGSGCRSCSPSQHSGISCSP